MIGFRKSLIVTAGWINTYFGSPVLRLLRRIPGRLRNADRCSAVGSWITQGTTQPLPARPLAPPLSFRCLEPRRVLSVNAVFAAGVLDVTIQNDGGNIDASLLSDDGVHFFVDANGDQTYDDGSTDPLELRGLLSELTRVNVLGDSGVGTFFWRDNFSAAMLSSPGTNAVDVSQVLSANLSATANVDGDVSVTAEQSILFGGALAISGDLTASTLLPTGTITGSASGSLEVTGHADLTAHDITLGAAAGDHLALGSLTVNATGSVLIAEDGSATDPDTLLAGTNTAETLNISSGGSITLESGATITTAGGLQLNASGTMDDIRIDGLLASTAGNITLHAGEQVAVGSDASITTGGPGEIVITADGSGIALADGSQLTTLDGAIRLTALDASGGDISLSQLATGNSPGAVVQIMAAGNITDATAGEGANILSPMGSLLLQSLGGSIGTAAEDLNIDVQNLVFDAGAATLGVVHISDMAGGLRINGTSRAAAGATITAHSPLTIAANVSVGASSTFTAGNSAAAGDNLTIENSAVVTLTSLAPAALTFNAGDDIVFRDGGRIVTTGANSHTVTLNADLDHAGLGAADGDRGSISQDGTPVIEVTTNRVIARAAEGIDLDTQIDNLDAISTFSGNIVIDEVDGITLDNLSTGNGAIDVMAAGTVAAVQVDSSGTDSDDNDVRITTTSGDVVVTLIRAGLFHGDVFVDAQRNILDGDTGPDNVDIEGNDVTLVAQTGNIGVQGSLFFKDRPNALEVVTHADPAFPLEPGNLSATALAGSIALDIAVAGSASFATNTLFVTAVDDLDFSTATLAVTNLALIADADGNGVGTLTLASSLAVVGDLRLEGANIVSTGAGAPLLNLAAARLLFRSAAPADILAAVQVLDASAHGDLSIRSTLSAIELVDLNCDNVALQTTNSAGSILFETNGTVTVADDVLAGNDGLTTSTGGIEFRFAAGATGDILIHDSLLTDQGNILLTAPGSIRVEAPAVADPFDEAGADNLPIISTIDGNIALIADSDGDGGGIFMADGARIIAGRAAIDYVPGIDGMASATTLGLGGDVKGAGLAQIELTATDSITLGSLQSANNTSNAVSVTSTTGAIVDGGDTDVDIVANNVGAQVTLSARNGVGSLNAIETAVAQLDVRNLGLTGNIGIHEVAGGGSLISLAALNAASGGSVLLAIDAGSLQVAGAGVMANAGNVTLVASNDVQVQSAISTTGLGDIYVAAGNDAFDAVPPNVDGITLDASLTTDAGNILLQSQYDLRATAQISSNLGAIGITSTRDITLSSGVATAADVLVDAGGNVVVTSTASIAGDNVLLAAGGSLGVAEVSGNRVALRAGGDITDNNAGAVNVQAGTLHIAAGGTIGQADIANGLPNENVNALDIVVDTVASRSATGIYLHQLAAGGDLVVATVPDLLVSVAADQVALDSSTLTVTAQQTVASEMGLRTTLGPIKVHVDSGDLSIGAGGVSAGGAGDVLLWASSDVNIGSAVSSGTGHVTLRAGDDVLVNAAVSTGGAGSLYLWAGNATAADATLPNVDGISLNGGLTTAGGSILLSSAQDIRVNAAVVSSTANVGGVDVSGNIGLVATGDITQLANITSAGDVLVDAGSNYRMTAGTALNTTGNVLGLAGQSISLATIGASRVSLVAGQDIVNVNGLATANVIASSLSMVAGGDIGGSDVANGTPDLNANAINVVADTLAARAGDSIYVQQLAAGGDLSIDSVAALNVSVAVSEVRFNSTTTNVLAAGQADARDDLMAGTGPIKLVVRDGSLTVNDGGLGGGVGVVAAGAGDVLLWAAGDITLAAAVDGGSGHVTIQAGDDLTVSADVRTTGVGTLYLRSENSVVGDAVGPQVDGLRVTGPLTADGSILLSSQGAISTSANITSSGGDLGLVATGDIDQAASLAAAVGNVLISTGGTFTQSGSLTAGGDVLISSSGNIALGLVTADQVSLVSAGDILDANGLNVLNVRADNLSMVAGGIIGGPDLLAAADDNAQAIDIDVNTLAARSRDGIYVQQLAVAGDLAVDLVVGAPAAAVLINQVRFNSTVNPIIAADPLAVQPLADLETTQGPIKLVVRSGNLTLNDGDGDTVSVLAGGTGDVLLQAAGGIMANASISSGTGHVTLQAGADVNLNAALFTAGAGTIFVSGSTIDVDAVVSTQTGDLLLTAINDIRTTASITSVAGSIGLLADNGQVLQGSTVSAGQDLLIEAGGDFTQSNVSASAAATAQVIADGSIRLFSITAAHVSLTAGQDILDNSLLENANIQAQTLAMVAGGKIGGADLANTADANVNAIDISVLTLAARSTNGIYVQQLASGGSLVVDHVEGSAAVIVDQVRFNSTRSTVAAGDPTDMDLRPLEDVVSTNGPVKIVVRNGSLAINDGLLADGIGVRAGGAQDVLLWANGSLTTQAQVISGGGHITLQASNDLSVNAATSTLLSGSIYLVSGSDIAVNANLSNVAGDMLLSAGNNLNTSGVLTSSGGSVGLIAVGDISQSANIAAGRDVLLTAGGNLTQTAIVTTAGRNLQASSVTGSLTIGELNAVHVSLTAGLDVLDGNGADVLNIRGSSVAIVAGGFIGGSDLANAPDANGRAIDLAVDRVAARAGQGIYLQQLSLGGNLTIDHVEGSSSLSVSQVRFNSTTSTVEAGDTAGVALQPLNDLVTTDGPIKVVVRNGSLTVNDGNGDGLGVVAGGAGDVLLSSTGDLIANASITSDTGFVTLAAGGQLDLNAVVSTGGVGSIYLRGGAIEVDAAVDSLAGSILLTATDDIRTTAAIASQTGSVGLLAGRDVLQSAPITAGVDLLLQAGRDITQVTGTAQAGQTAQAIAGGSIRLDVIAATHVSLTAGQNILDNNGQDTLNIRANTLGMTAGGIIGGADLANVATANAQALDLEVSTVAARSASGVYLQQLAAGGDLTIDRVAGSVAVTVDQVRFNSSRTAEVVSNPLLPLNDIDVIDGPVKVVVLAGRLIVNDGTDADGIGVSAGNGGDVLLSASSDVVLSASVLSGSGHIQVSSGRDLTASAAIQTSGEGTIYLVATNDQQLSGSIATQNQDVLIVAGCDILHTGTLTSQMGDVGVMADRDMTHSGSISTAGDVIVETGHNLGMGTGSIAAGVDLLIRSGTNTVDGGQQLGQLSADHVSLNATGAIVDGNAGTVNVTANTLRVIGNSLGTQADPLDLSVDTLAVETQAGIYVQQLAGRPSLTVGHVAMTAGEVSVQQVNFNSSRQQVDRTLQLSGLSDLQTARSQTGIQSAIEVNVVSGDLKITDGQDADKYGVLVTTGNIHLRTSGVGNITIQSGIETKGVAAAGRITLEAADNVMELANVTDGSVSDAQVIGDSLVIQAGGYAHLHQVSVNSLQATVGANGQLDAAWQQTNDRASKRGDDFLDQLRGKRPDDAQFRFEDTYDDAYALFIQNSKTLDVQQVMAGNLSSAKPSVYIETMVAAANLKVSGSIVTTSSTDIEGGIVLVAGGKLDMQGSLITSSELDSGVTRIQRIDNIGSSPTVDALGRAAVGYLNGRVFNGGEGVTPRHPLLTSTQFVIREQAFGLSGLSENYRSHVFQRVVAQYGFVGESGFVAIVGYADGEFQQFDTFGESGARSTRFNNTDPANELALPAVPRDLTQATAFSRATPFSTEFLNTNRELPTTALIRRAADFFLFENAAADAVGDIRDLTVESFQVKNVNSTGDQGAIEMPRDVAPMEPPIFGLTVLPEIFTNPTQLVRNDIELAAIGERTVEVAIYRVYYEDLNLNGQAEESELPDEEQILAAEVAEEPDEEKKADEMPPGKRLKLETVKTASGGSPTAEDIEALKNEFLNDPERPSGAYSIIEKGLDDQEVVLDIFSVRDRTQETDANEKPLVRPPTPQELQQQQLERTDEPEVEVVPAPTTDGARYQPPHSGGENGETWDTPRAESRFAHAGLVASSLWFARAHVHNSASTNSGRSLTETLLDDSSQTPIDFGRRGRRSRRWQRRKLK